jgi:hypothetical protein
VGAELGDLGKFYWNETQDINVSVIEQTNWRVEHLAGVDSVLAELDNTLNLTLTHISGDLWSLES